MLMSDVIWSSPTYLNRCPFARTATFVSKGPNFKIKLELQNQGERALTNLPIAFSYDRDIYSMERGQFIVSTLLPVS